MEKKKLRNEDQAFLIRILLNELLNRYRFSASGVKLEIVSTGLFYLAHDFEAIDLTLTQFCENPDSLHFSYKKKLCCSFCFVYQSMDFS